ncbi:MAG TPA: NUDIX hydrolase [Candidatus Woesebacteria bacterium]|nr:NUDIX hydrolase [Candidatus Woesebacteria bacterium]
MKKKDNEIKYKSLLPEDQNPITKPIFSGGFYTPCPLTEDQKRRFFLGYPNISLPNGPRPHVPLFSGKVKIISSRIAYCGRVMKMLEVTETHTKFDREESRPFTWSMFHRKGGSAVLIHDVIKNEVLLVEQIRPAILIESVDEENVNFALDKNGHMIEIVAGGFGKDTPEVCAIREVFEETGIKIKPDNLQNIMNFYLSPGGSTEIICLYYAPITSKKTKGKGGGLSKENEDIKCHWVSLYDASLMLSNNEIKDAKTIIAIQWLLAQKR